MLTTTLWLSLVLQATAPVAADEPKPEPKTKARLEVDAKTDCFTVRFFIKNQGDKDVVVTVGAGSGGQTVVPTFMIGVVQITPPIYRFPLRRALRPDRLTIPAHQEVLYGTYTMGYPPRQFLERPHVTIEAYLQFDERGEREPMLRLKTSPSPFPPLTPHHTVKKK